MSKEAASLNTSYMQQYEALSEALIGIMAFSEIAEEAGRLYPNVKNEGGQDSRMELFLDELVKIRRSATRAKMQKAEAAAKEVKNSTPGVSIASSNFVPSIDLINFQRPKARNRPRPEKRPWNVLQSSPLTLNRSSWKKS